MAERATRIALVILAANGFLLGLWAGFAPQSFYDDFPGGGRSWVSVDGPYNEHIVRDVGVYSLGLAIVTIAAVRGSRFMRQAVSVAWIATSVPHLVYHLRHMDVYDTSDKIGSIGGLALGAALPVIALITIARTGDREPAHAVT